MRNSVIVTLVVLIYFCSCSAFKVKPRIVDGRPAGPGQFSYYVFLEIELLNGSHSACGASIISADWVISAAHCLMNARNVKVHFGEYLLNQPEPGHTPILVQSDRFHINSDYPQNDIGMFWTFYTKSA